MRGGSGQVCNITIQGPASNNFLILSAKSKSALDLVCNCFPAKFKSFVRAVPSPDISPNLTRLPGQEYFVKE